MTIYRKEFHKPYIRRMSRKKAFETKFIKKIMNNIKDNESDYVDTVGFNGFTEDFTSWIVNGRHGVEHIVKMCFNPETNGAIFVCDCRDRMSDDVYNMTRCRHIVYLIARIVQDQCIVASKESVEEDTNDLIYMLGNFKL